MASSLLSLSHCLLWGEPASCQVMRTLKQSVERPTWGENWGQPPTISKELRPPDNSHVSEPSLKQILQLPSSFQMMAAQPTSWLQIHEESWVRILELSHSQIPKPQKLWNNDFFFFLLLHLWSMNVAGLGVELKLHLRPALQPQQCWIWATSLT